MEITKLKDTDERYPMFSDLNSELKEHNISLNIYCVGGYVMSLQGLKVTQDVDAFYKRSALLDSLIDKVGIKYGLEKLGEPWLNNSVENVADKPDDSEFTQIYSFSNLNVFIASLQYVLCMKLCTDRDKDISDIEAIVRRLQLKSPLQICKQAEIYGFYINDEAMARILDAFTAIYGMDWLTDYYKEHDRSIWEYMERSQPRR